MSRIILLGNPGTKRAVYFQKAAAQMGVPCHLWAWGGPQPADLTGILKIDPPLWDSCSLGGLSGCVGQYERELEGLAGLADRCGLRFFNHPASILELLDKKRCKEKLMQAQIPVTEPLAGAGGDVERLLCQMEERRIFQVFVKPRYGSGAAGAAAFRWQPKSGGMALYTCAAVDPQTGRLVNTKRLRAFREKEEVCMLLDRLLQLDVVVERWYAKAGYQGSSYDLRAVVQDGQLDFLLARLSKGPITNLHLNNRPLSAEELGLSREVLDDVLGVCQKAAACYPGLRSAGIDILLEKGRLKPRVIEMNGQGDLIYQDIYHENRIYRHQVEMMGACV